MNFRRTLPAAAAALLSTSLLCGFTYVNNVVDWAYFGTPATTGGLTYNTTDGTPTILEFSRTLPAGLPALPSDLATKIAYTLPEGRDIRKNSQGLLPDSDDKTNLRFSEDADVWVSFLSEGAGYRNAVGYFTYDPANPPKSPADVKEKILFVNASTSVPLDTAGTKYQNTVNLGKFKAGTALGFMIVANGYSDTGRLVNGKRVAGVTDKPDRKWVFYSLRALNPEASSAQNLNVHTIMLKDLSSAGPNYQRVVLGFEDINRESGGDHDFNDVVLAVHVTPQRAIANLPQLQQLVSASDLDSDGDGVKDGLDEYPKDNTRAFTRRYPAGDGFGTLAYEDKWPLKGDYDMNDLVMRYRVRETLNAARNVVSMEADYRLDARGAFIESGFAVQLPGVARSAIKSATLTKNGGTPVVLTPEAGQSLATLVLFNNAVKELPGTSTACSFANTQAECAAVPVVNYTLKVEFTSPQPGASMNAPYNPFIFRTATRGHEVHLPGKAPTDLVDKTLFGTQDDRTVLAANKTYVDKNGRPWALDLPIEWKYPNETIDLTVPYPNMATWASSGGTSNVNWYVSATAPKWLWVKK